MSDIKKIMDSNTSSEMDLLCQQYDGFYRYMKLLKKLASSIASGKIQVPSSRYRTIFIASIFYQEEKFTVLYPFVFSYEGAINIWVKLSHFILIKWSTE